MMLDFTAGWLDVLVLASDEATHGAEAASKPGLMDMQVSMMFWTWVAFFLFMWVLSRYAWAPIAKMLKERSDRIEGDIERAGQLKKDADELKRQYNDKMEQIHEEIEQMRRLGREKGELIKIDIEEKAKLEAKEIIERARREIELEKKGALAEVRVTTLEMALKIASEVVKESLDDEKHLRLAEEALRHLDDIPAV